MKFTGERMIPDENEGSKIHLEHILRYNFTGKLAEGRDVLDIACGSGYGSKILSDFGAKSVIGVDISPEAIEYCKSNYENIDFRIGSVSNIPLKDDSVDLIVSFETLEHVGESEQEEFFSEAKRVLKKGGQLIISTPNAYVSSGENEFHKKELTPSEFEELIGKYFKFRKVFYQDLLESSYIFSPDISNGIVRISEVNRPSPGKSLFLIALCSDEKENINLIEGGRLVGISSTRLQDKFDYYNQIVLKKNERLKNIQKELRAMEMEIEKMGFFNFHLLKNKYSIYKNKLIFLFFHPIGLIKKFGEKLVNYVRW